MSFDFRRGRRFFFSPSCPDNSGATQHRRISLLHPRVKWPEHETDHSLPSSLYELRIIPLLQVTLESLHLFENKRYCYTFLIYHKQRVYTSFNYMSSIAPKNGRKTDSQTERKTFRTLCDVYVQHIYPKTVRSIIRIITAIVHDLCTHCVAFHFLFVIIFFH
jgi:hypothetical protein